jgi:hypothetical protein
MFKTPVNLSFANEALGLDQADIGAAEPAAARRLLQVLNLQAR